MKPSQEYRKKTILQVVPSLISGGVERGTVEIAKRLKESEFESIVISAGGYMVDMLRENSIRHIKLNVVSKNPFVIWKNARLISQIIKECDVDIVHARSRAPAWSCYLAAKATGKHFITTFHGIYNISGPIKRYYNSIMAKGERIIAVSNFVKEHILNNYNAIPENIRVIHRGVDHRQFDPSSVSEEHADKFREKYNITSKTPIILLPSRLTFWKGHLTLIEALNKIRDLDFHCLIVGDLAKHPNFVKEVQSKIVEYKLQKKIQIFGNESNMSPLYAISDIILSTSHEPEAFGRVVIEAQSMEKIVIATNIGGAAETITDGKTGFHVKAKDSSDLSEKIRYCLENLKEPSMDEMRKKARRSVIKNFSLDDMLKETLKIYRELI